MTRRRYLYTLGGRPLEAPIEVSEDYTPPARTEIAMGNCYEGLRATDGADISSRAKYHEYMRLNGVAPESDFTETRAKAAAARAEYLAGRTDSRELADFIGRKAYELRHKRRR